MHAEYGAKVEFLVVYITEAHALDGARPLGGGDGHPIVEEPITLGERKAVATTCERELDLSPLKVVIDDMKNTAGTAYSAHPDRLYLVGKAGKIAYAGARGPRGFKPGELEDAIRSELDLPPKQVDEKERR